MFFYRKGLFTSLTISNVLYIASQHEIKTNAGATLLLFAAIPCGTRRCGQ
jgi:hypothetical protein